MPLFKGRQLRRFDDSCQCPQEYCEHDRIIVQSAAEADLVGSDVIGSEFHFPVIDLDIPAQLVPSATPGHNHLYIDVAVPWDKYKRLLAALADCNIVEVGFVDASIARGHTSVRVPWKPKEI